MTDRQYATVGGGFTNTASGSESTVSGGRMNVASGPQSTVGGGSLNDATNNWATVAGGNNNDASSQYSTISGGVNNIASGLYSTVPGGHTNSAAGQFSFAAGRRAKANHDGAFVWGDQTDADFTSTAADQFLIRAAGGVGIGTASPAALLTLNQSVGTDVGGIRLVDGAVTYSLYGDAGGDFHLKGGGAATEDLVFDAAGNLGIGTTNPTALLEVAGDLLVGGPTASNKAVYASSGNHLRLLSGNTGGAALLFQSGTPASPSELMRIDGATGNIGVGTAVVTEKLMVAGNVVPSADNTHSLGTSGLRWTDVFAFSGSVNASDRRLKENIEDIVHGLDEIRALRPVSYTWKSSPGRGTKLGLIAQEVLPVVEEVVHVGDDEDQTLGLYYSDLIPVLIKAVQEQQEIIEQQREQLEEQAAEDAAMEARMDDLNEKLELLVASIADNKTELHGSIEGSLENSTVTMAVD